MNLFRHRKVVKKPKKVASKSIVSSSLNGSLIEGDSHKKLPDLHTLRLDMYVQVQVEARIRQLSENDSKGTNPKYKSQQSDSVDIFVKERVKWPHEFVLAGNTKERVTYNQLNITQWMAGFCRITRAENCQQTKHHMLVILLPSLVILMIFGGKLKKLVMLCYVRSNKVR